MEYLDRKEVKRAIKTSSKSKIAKSCRRIFFTHCHNSLEESSNYYVDLMYGAGTGILLKLDKTFFLLTAKHVINANIPSKYQNESPFFVSVNTKLPVPQSLTDYLYPKIMWNIGDLISVDEKIVNNSDICLVELFDHPIDVEPDNYISLDTLDDVLSKKECYSGQFLVVNGFPIQKNYYKHFNEDGEHYYKSTKKITHYTPHVRSSILGCLDYETDNPYITFEITEGKQNHASLDGMSGGIVCNVQATESEVKWVGVSVTAGDNILRFIFISDIVEAILKYKTVSSHIIDPIVGENSVFPR